jgi:hypothetical protein
MLQARRDRYQYFARHLSSFIGLPSWFFNTKSESVTCRGLREGQHRSYRFAYRYFPLTGDRFCRAICLHVTRLGPLLKIHIAPAKGDHLAWSSAGSKLSADKRIIIGPLLFEIGNDRIARFRGEWIGLPFSGSTATEIHF